MARPVKTKGLFKAYTPFTPEELKKIDQWGFKRSIRNRADVIRILVIRGLADTDSRRKPSDEA